MTQIPPAANNHIGSFLVRISNTESMTRYIKNVIWIIFQDVYKRQLSRRPAVLNDSPLLSYGDLSFNPEKQELTVSNKTLSLSKKEAGLMEYLLKNKEQNLRRNLMLSYVWGADAEVEEGNLDNYIYFLRRRPVSYTHLCKKPDAGS